MESAGQDEDGRKAAGRAADRVKLDRRAEGLRANLKRRKAQSRGRAEAERPAAAAPRD